MTKTDAKSDRRYLWNLCMFTVSFVISNLVSGIIYDVYVNYLQEVGREVAVSFWSYYGYSAFISAALLLLIPKIGLLKRCCFSVQPHVRRPLGRYYFSIIHICML